MIYKRPAIQVLRGLDAFFDRLLPRTFDAPAGIDWRVKALKEFIDSHSVIVRWNVDDISKELGLSLSGRQLRRLFKISTGMGIREYAKNRCLASAAEQLRTTHAPVKIIAADHGYQSTCHFARSFRELFHLNPMEFRRIWHRGELAA
jgi:AraC family mar-sox-rob regulon transcriptional activator